MKANEAPEKLYFGESDKDLLDIFYSHRESNDDIEYTRTDAFIKKACEYLNKTCRRFLLTEKDIEDFKNYMEGE